MKIKIESILDNQNTFFISLSDGAVEFMQDHNIPYVVKKNLIYLSYEYSTVDIEVQTVTDLLTFARKYDAEIAINQYGNDVILFSV